MTPEEIAATFADFQSRLDALTERLNKSEEALRRRVDALADYAGATHYLATQTKLSTDRRLSYLESKEGDVTTP